MVINSTVMDAARKLGGSEETIDGILDRWIERTVDWSAWERLGVLGLDKIAVHPENPKAFTFLTFSSHVLILDQCAFAPSTVNRDEVPVMPPAFSALLAFVAAWFRSRAALHLEHLALRHQLAVYKQTIARPRLRPTDRLFWAWLSRLWSGWQSALAFVQPHTVIAWQHQRFRDHWRRLSQRGTLGRPTIAKEVRDLIRTMWQTNPTWGAPRIVGELRKLGIDVAKSTVERYRVRPKRPPSSTWKTFLKYHVQDLVALDFFAVPTVTRKVLFVLLILAHERRRVVHVNVTEHPTTAWTTQQVINAFP
jgi:putative transposase